METINENFAASQMNQQFPKDCFSFTGFSNAPSFQQNEVSKTKRVDEKQISSNQKSKSIIQGQVDGLVEQARNNAWEMFKVYRNEPNVESILEDEILSIYNESKGQLSPKDMAHQVCRNLVAKFMNTEEYEALASKTIQELRKVHPDFGLKVVFEFWVERDLCVLAEQFWMIYAENRIQNINF